MNRSVFFDDVRRSVFGGKLSQTQVNGLTRVAIAAVLLTLLIGGCSKPRDYPWGDLSREVGKQTGAK